MSSEPKPFASLSSGLLARKGAARPAMRPQGFGQAGAALEDLGWNDMGFEPPKPTEAPRDDSHDAFGEAVVELAHVHPTGLTPVQSPVHSQQAEIVERFAGDELAEAEVEAEAEAEQAEPVEQVAIPAFLDSVDETAELYEADPADESAEVYAPEPPAIPAVRVRAAPPPKPRREVRSRFVAGAKNKAAFTLRLDPARHLKLRLACAVGARSAQQLVTDALDQLLDQMPELDAMAETAKRKG